jgi:hypothetical protein
MPGDFVNNLTKEINILKETMKEEVFTIVTQQEIQEIHFLQQFTNTYIHLIKK